MLSSAPARMLDHSAYRLERIQSCRSGRPLTVMSLDHRSDHAAACAANSCDQPCAAAACAADTADPSGLAEVSAVSTPTYLSKVYDVPALALKVTASRAVRF